MITSTNNSRIKRIAEYSKKAKARREDGVFLVEGIRMLREAPLEDIREVYATSHFLSNLSAEDSNIIEEIQSDEGISFEEVSDDVMRKMADTQTPQGVIAVVKQKKWTLQDVINGGAVSNAPLLLILENIQDPGNLGNMFRTGEGAGITGIIMSSDMADVYNPKVVRSTMGAIFRVPFIYADSIPDTVKNLKDSYGVTSYAAHLRGKKNYDQIDYKNATAFIIGNEGNGLTKVTADAATDYVLIPMLGKVESMNAATSAAILTFEAARQRRQ
ncbi:TrmH family RNA methyltransferase [Butyrivibrio sp. AE3004]|uniref:TrmH family RNA methyltransferase n=1 Tax=Butyrivibrio sp. AE3004 TaxID=1506994 RepID=UPI000493FCEA|nr:RNA methyltransferase [Butyrivibrio sp. AE3004]